MISVRPFYSLSDKEIYHQTSEVIEDKYTINLYFYTDTDYYYQECMKRLHGKLSYRDRGLTVLYLRNFYQISIDNLDRGEGNMEHGFIDYTFNNFYIRLYWNNNKKTIIFYAPE